MKKSAKLARVLVATTLSVTMALGVTIPAEAIQFNPPTPPVSTDDNVIKCFAGRVARFNPVLLGGDLVSTSSITIGNNADNLAGIFGSELNDSYDPWIWNYAYNSQAAEGAKVDNAVTATDVADGKAPTAEQYSYLLTNRPDLLLNQGAVDAGATSMAADNAAILEAISAFPENAGKEKENFEYSPVLQTCSIGTFVYQVQNVKNVAKTMNDICAKTGKTTRYGNPETIASNFEKFIWGTYSYVLKQVDTGKVAKKTVAVLASTADDGATWSAPGVCTSAQMGKPNRLVEYVRDYCNTPLNVASPKGAATTVSIADIAAANCDVIIASGNGAKLEAALKAAGVSEEKMPLIVNDLPGTIVGIVMQSNENGFGLPYFASLIYGEEIGLNPVYTAAYWYKNFLHISNQENLQTVTSYMLQSTQLGGRTTDLSGFDQFVVGAMVEEGCAYAIARNAAGNSIMMHSSEMAFNPENPYVEYTAPIVYRMYNGATSEHLWTTDTNEYQVLVNKGWTQEGHAWTSPAAGKGVYRLYNAALGTHHYTADTDEINVLTTSEGWVLDNDGKPMFYSASYGTPLYRMYNGNLSQHMLTLDKNEYEGLVKHDWQQEGIGFYAVAA